MSSRIHIFGASGSGTTTLGSHLGKRLNIPHFDSDNYYWKKTNPPFQEKNAIPERHLLLLADLKGFESWVLSGSMHSWSEPFETLFDLVVFLYVPADIRIKRLKAREYERYGNRVLPGGDMHQAHLEFIDWAAQYDEGTLSGRSKNLHEDWMARIKCSVLRIEKEIDTDSAIDLVLQKLNENRSRDL